ncbi:AEC family transporter [Pseudoroseicyclus tamaricis]|uniref:AEC family transporter n=1 Tax=Pseudoroseicyclus tamaricis TaxID=2705421 RepID=A0A6B2JLZ1_9RHOB|nr:AEC family transporter [Pseudoroseicyclus tamaricis]NDV02591.1 AEC family transporter [Pseudoroseicyclus tamaricis]
MLAVFLQTLPFFAIIGLGYGAGKVGFFTAEATAYLTKFVFYFALSAMILRFTVTLGFGEIFSWPFVLAYLSATLAGYLIVTAVALARGRGMAEAAVEAQTGVIGNTGFLGLPMLGLLIGEAAIGPALLVLSVDLIVFSSLFTVLMTLSRGGRFGLALLWRVLRGLVENPMIVSLAVGLTVAALDLPVPEPVMSLLTLLGAAATPGALFAIGASLATKSAERLGVAAWLTSVKLVLHPALVAGAALFLFNVDPFAASVMIAAAALPVAGNVYMLAQVYGVAPQRVSAAILLSTTAAIVTFPLVIAQVTGG